MPKIATEKRRVKTFYWSNIEQGIIDEVKEIMIKIDMMKYGKDFVEEELKKRNKGRYSDSKIMRYIIEKGGGILLKMLSEEYEQMKKKTKNTKNKKSIKKADFLEKIVKNIGKESELYWTKIE